jgi:DNA-directed RNA polymerase subunit H (RpoH/RPB5)
MAEVEFARYNNIITFATEWRKYQMDTKPLDKEVFRKTMQTDQYVKLECHDPRKDKTVLIFLFDKTSKYVASSQDMKKLLKKIKDACQVILITYQALNVYHRKAIANQKLLTVSVYRHEIFDLVLPKGPLCYPHRVMSRDEVIKLTNEDMCCYVINLPKILDEDPQCIWIGAEVGDVVEIKMLSDVSGETYQYRVVIPKSGKVIAYKETAPVDAEVAPAAENEEDEEIQEHRENKDDGDDEADDEDVEEHEADHDHADDD